MDREVLSRTDGRTWAEEKAKDDFPGWEAIKKPQMEDYENLAEVVLSTIDTVLELESTRKLPTYEQAEDMYRVLHFEWPEKLPRLHEFGSRQIIEGGEGQPSVMSNVYAVWKQHDSVEGARNNHGDRTRPVLVALVFIMIDPAVFHVFRSFRLGSTGFIFVLCDLFGVGLLLHLFELHSVQCSLAQLL